MSQSVKISISLSQEDFSIIEETRKREGLTRSGVIAKAINMLKEEVKR